MAIPPDFFVTTKDTSSRPDSFQSGAPFHNDSRECDRNDEQHTRQQQHTRTNSDNARMRFSFGFLITMVVVGLTICPHQVLAQPTDLQEVTIGQSRWPASQQPFASGDVSSPHNSLNEGRSSTNLTNAVEWDGYSLFVRDKRVFVWSVIVLSFGG
jgi:hypothetical protein